MNKLAIIDIDGVIASNDARFAKAEEAKNASLTGKGLLAQVLVEEDPVDNRYMNRDAVKQDLIKQATERKNSGLVFWNGEVYQKEDMQEADNVYWRTAFTPDLVALDTLIDGVPQALERIERAGYDVLFLTSRPESMRQATVDWLWSLVPDTVLLSQEGASWDQLIMKPASQQFVKTVTWKSGVVELLVRLFDVDELLFCDDEQKIQDAITELDLPCDTIICGNLQEALISIGGK